MCRMIQRDIPPDAPLLLAGDFNDWRNRAHRFLADHAGLKEVFVSTNGEAARTFPARLPVLQLDRIYLRNATVHTPLALAGRPWSHLSDHAPLAAEIRL
jgi:endonuclease/exonuclease/phosphatase family metal-dependent hydrolase